jgi:hypothetical protein
MLFLLTLCILQLRLKQLLQLKLLLNWLQTLLLLCWLNLVMETPHACANLGTKGHFLKIIHVMIFAQ